MSSPEKGNKKVRYIVLVVAVAGLVLLLLPKFDSLWGSDEQGKGGGGGAAPGRGSATPVNAYQTASEVVSDKILVTGSVLPNEQVNLVSEVAGKVEKILFSEGAQVQAGAELVRLNDSELRAQLQRAEYRKNLAELNEQRKGDLLKRDALSKAEYDMVLNELNVVKAEIALLEAQLAKTVVRAPFSGIIGLRNISPGSYISPNTPIATLQSVNPVKVEFTVPEKYASSIRRGDRLSYSIQGVEGTRDAVVYAVEPSIDQNTRSIRVRARSSNPGGHVMPGAFAEVQLSLKTVDNAILIPTEAVVPELQGQKVFLYENGTVRSQAIETGIRTPSRIQVVNGLKPGDTVITTGLLQIRDGAAVEIVDMQSAE